MNWGHPRKNPSKKFGCDTSCKFVTRLGKDLQYSPSLVPSCTRSRSNFSDEVFFLGCRNLWMVCVKIRRCIKGGGVPLASAPVPALIIAPFGNTDKTRPGRVLRYPHCGCSDAAPATPGLNTQCTLSCDRVLYEYHSLLLKLPYKCVKIANCRVNCGNYASSILTMFGYFDFASERILFLHFCGNSK